MHFIQNTKLNYVHLHLLKRDILSLHQKVSILHTVGKITDINIILIFKDFHKCAFEIYFVFLYDALKKILSKDTVVSFETSKISKQELAARIFHLSFFCKKERYLPTQQVKCLICSRPLIPVKK